MLARASKIDDVLGAAVGGGVEIEPSCCSPRALRRSTGGLPGGVVDSPVRAGEWLETGN
jgi:hypothetical protein